MGDVTLKFNVRQKSFTPTTSIHAQLHCYAAHIHHFSLDSSTRKKGGKTSGSMSFS